MQPLNRNAIIATVYFILSVLITGWFIEQKFWFFASPSAILLSNIIAIGKWVVLVIAAILLLKDKKWTFIRRLSFACFASSCTLISFYAFEYLPFSSWEKLRSTMILAVIVMTIIFYKAVIDTGISKKWLVGWFVCLALSITLQTTVVFA